MAKKLPDGWRTSYCTLIAEGYTHKDAADAVGINPGTVRRHLQEDDELRDLYQEARETVRDKVRNKVWQMGMDGSLTTDKDGDKILDGPTTRWALDHLIKWNLPEARETQRAIEAEGADAGIAEAIDRFTNLVAHAIAVRELRDPPTLRAAITSGAPLRERES